MARQGEYDGSARECAASGEDAGGFVEPDRALAAQDPKQGLAVHPDVAGDLVTGLAGDFNGVGEGARD